MSLLPGASTAAVGGDSGACPASITNVLEQVPVARGLTGVQVVTGALSAFLAAKEHAGGLCLSLFGFVYWEKVEQSSIPEHILFREVHKCILCYWFASK